MPREILIRIINEKLISDLIIILFVYFLVELTILALSFQMLGTKTKYRKIVIGGLFLIVFNLFGKQFFSDLAYGLLYISLLIIVIKTIGGRDVSWIRAFWSSFLSLFVSAVSVLTIQITISLNPTIAKFITTTPLGVACGAICEMVFPIIFLFLLKTVNFSFILPAKQKLNLLDVANLAAFALPFLLLYNAFARTLKYLDTYSRSDLIKDMLYEWLIVGLELGIFRFIYTSNKKMLENQQKNHQEQLELQQKQHDERLKFEQQRFVEEQHMNQEKMQKLEEQHQRLSKMYEELKNTKERPQKVVDALSVTMFALKEYYDSLTIKNESDVVIEKNDLAGITINDTESNIIELIIQGKTDKEIAKVVHLSSGRVSNIIAELLSKTGLNNRTMLAVHYALIKYSNK